MADSRFVYVTYIRATPAKVWEALTTSEFMKSYFFGASFDTDWKAGSPWRMVHSDGRVTDSGEIEEISAPERLVLTWRSEWLAEAKDEGYSQLVAEVEDVNGVTKLSVTHAIAVEGSKLIQAVSGGWPRILSNLKSVLETGSAVFASK